MLNFIAIVFGVMFGTLISTLIMGAVSIMLVNNDGLMKRYSKWIIRRARKFDDLLEEVLEEEES